MIMSVNRYYFNFFKLKISTCQMEKRKVLLFKRKQIRNKWMSQKTKITNCMRMTNFIIENHLTIFQTKKIIKLPRSCANEDHTLKQRNLYSSQRQFLSMWEIIKTHLVVILHDQFWTFIGSRRRIWISKMCKDASMTPWTSWLPCVS